MKKIRVTDELIEKAVKVFRHNQVTFAGYGLSRGELRALERKGILTKKYGKNRHTGAIVCGYVMNSYDLAADPDMVKQVDFRPAHEPAEKEEKPLFLPLFLYIRSFLIRMPDFISIEERLAWQ